jgi:hypothetical protein
MMKLRKLCGKFRVQPTPAPTNQQNAAVRTIQRAFRQNRFARTHGHTLRDAWTRIVDAASRTRRRERKNYIIQQMRVNEQRERLRKGGALREDWRFLKQPPGGVLAADPHLPLKRVTVWTHHDVALFVAVAWRVGVPRGSVFASRRSKLKPFFSELCPPHRERDVETMLLRLQASGAIEKLSYLSYLSSTELDRLLPAWVADDVRKSQ